MIWWFVLEGVSWGPDVPLAGPLLPGVGVFRGARGPPSGQHAAARCRPRMWRRGRGHYYAAEVRWLPGPAQDVETEQRAVHAQTALAGDRHQATAYVVRHLLSCYCHSYTLMTYIWNIINNHNNLVQLCLFNLAILIAYIFTICQIVIF